MPKKQSKAQTSNIKLRRSKPTAQNPEYLTDEDEICLETTPYEQAAVDEHEQEADDNDAEFEEPQPVKPQKVKQATQQQKKIKKPKLGSQTSKSQVILKNELELFKQYMKEQRELLAKDRAEHLEQIKQNDKNKYSTDARMRLMSIL